jgi:hypothetical protein
MKVKYGTLYYNTDKEEGEFVLSEDFPAGVIGLDILLDWVNDLKEEYNERLKRGL